jgi:hypothetical protein
MGCCVANKQNSLAKLRAQVIQIVMSKDLSQLSQLLKSKALDKDQVQILSSDALTPKQVQQALAIDI